ncbi:MAG: hypothetical protein IT445_08050 [Phycisphaeraceae bacterium]|nr:hypothetical protein [Phycisphaeraceae bacterium]
MRVIVKATDHDGHQLQKGDTVAALSDNMTGKVCELAGEDGEQFVRVRPIFQSYGKGVWHAAEHVRWLSSPKAKN